MKKGKQCHDDNELQFSTCC